MHIIPYLGYLLRIITALFVTIHGVLEHYLSTTCINSFPIVRLQKRGRKKYIFDQHTNLRCSFVLFITWKTCDNSIITPTPCSVVEYLKDAFVSTFSICDYCARNTSYMYLMHSFCLYMIHFLPIVIEFES